MVIVSGMVTSRTSFSFGSSAAWPLQPLRAAAERGDRALAHFVGAERGDQRQPAARSSARRRARAWARAPDARRGPPGPRRGARRFLFLGLERRARGRRRARRPWCRPRRSASSRPPRPCAWSLRRACGAPLPRACALRRRRARRARCASRAVADRALLPRRSCALRPRAAGRRRARARGALRSSSVRVRSTTPDGLGRGRPPGLRPAPRPAAGGASCRSARALGRRRGRGRPRPSACAGTRLLTFSTTTALVRPWLKLWRTTPCSTRALQRQRLGRRDAQRLFASLFVVSAIPIPILRLRHVRHAGASALRPFCAACLAGPTRLGRSGNARGARRAPETSRLRGRQAGLHVPHLTGPMPNPIGPR